MPAPPRPRQLWPLPLMLLLATCCLAGPGHAAAHSHRHWSPTGRALQATNRTAVAATSTTNPAQQPARRSTGGCGTKPPSPELKQLIRDRIAAVNAAAAKPAAAAAAGKVGIAAAAQSGLHRATSITIGLVFHIILDPNVAHDENGQTYETAGHRSGGDLPTCDHLTGPAGPANIEAQVDRLNAAFDGVSNFVKLAVLQYEVVDAADPPGAGACVDNTYLISGLPCSKSLVTNYISSSSWVTSQTDPSNWGSTVPGDPNHPDFRPLLWTLMRPGSRYPALSPSILNVFMWDWDFKGAEPSLGLSSYFDTDFPFNPPFPEEDFIVTHCETTPGGSGALTDTNTAYSANGARVNDGGQLVHHMGHSLGLFHVSQGDGGSGCFPLPFGGDEVDDTHAQEVRGDDPLGFGSVDPQSWCPAEALDTCPFFLAWA